MLKLKYMYLFLNDKQKGAKRGSVSTPLFQNSYSKV